MTDGDSPEQIAIKRQIAVSKINQAIHNIVKRQEEKRQNMNEPDVNAALEHMCGGSKAAEEFAKNVKLGFEPYEKPMPEDPVVAKAIEQMLAIVDCRDGRVERLIEDFGGAETLARVAAAIWLAGMDKLNGLELVKK